MNKYIHKIALVFVFFCFPVVVCAHTVKIKVTAANGISVSGTPVLMEGNGIGFEYSGTLPQNGEIVFNDVYSDTYTLLINKEGLAAYYNNSLVINKDEELDIVLQEIITKPFDLQPGIQYNDQTGKADVKISWNGQNGIFFFDNFESYDDFVMNFSPWTGIDADGKVCVPIYGVEYPNQGMPRYGIIFNPTATNPSLWADPHIRPYSGLKFVSFSRASGSANNDWLISPKVKVNPGNIVSFMAKTFNIAYGKERFKVAVSTTENDNISKFEIINPGNFIEVADVWTNFSYELTKYIGKEIYVAINCITNEGSMLMVDDFYIGPPDNNVRNARAKRISPAIKKEQALDKEYKIFLNSVPIGQTKDTEFVVKELSSGEYKIGVCAVYQTAESDTAFINVKIEDASSFATVLANISTNNDKPVETKSVSFINSSIGIEYVKEITDGKINIPFAFKGDYLLSIDIDGFEKYTSGFELSKDTVINIELIEEIVTPFNLYVDYVNSTDEKTDAILTWNKKLSWKEDFESYDDFTQNISPWITYDLDGKHTFGLMSSTGETITFPGSGEPMAAIIFNPEKTTPPMGDAAAIPANGKKYVAFFTSDVSPSDDWLISPQLKIGRKYSLEFIAKSYNPTYGFEQFEIAISEKGTNVNDFEILDLLQAPQDWTRFSVDLSKYEGKDIYVAFHYISFNTFFMQLDDIRVGANNEESETPEIPDTDYEVYLNNQLKGSTNKTSYTFSDILANTTYNAGVKAIYRTGASGITDLSFTYLTSGIGDIDMKLLSVYPTLADEYIMVEAEENIKSVKIYGMSGVLYKNIYVNENRYRIDISSLSAGIYFIDAITESGSGCFKVIVK